MGILPGKSRVEGESGGTQEAKSGSSCLPFCHLVSQQGPPFPEPLVLFTGVGEE